MSALLGKVIVEKICVVENLEQIKKKTIKDDLEARAKFNKKKDNRIMVLEKEVADQMQEPSV